MEIVIDKEVKVNDDILIEILKRRFPECSVRPTSFHPFLGGRIIVRKSVFLRVYVNWKEIKDTGDTYLLTQHDSDNWIKPLTGYLPAYIIHCIVKGDFELEVLTAICQDLGIDLIDSEDSSDDTQAK